MYEKFTIGGVPLLERVILRGVFFDIYMKRKGMICIMRKYHFLSLILRDTVSTSYSPKDLGGKVPNSPGGAPISYDIYTSERCTIGSASFRVVRASNLQETKCSHSKSSLA